jgi:uncharacterized RDD family membrane protein YckC
MELAHAGSIRPDTLVWRAGMAEWKPFQVAGPAVPPPLYTAATTGGLRYAGFWIRFAAVIIDGMVLGALSSVIFFIFFGSTLFSMFQALAQGADPSQSAAFAGVFGATMGVFQLFALAFQIAYLSFMWFRWGATLGQMTLGLKVVKPDGSPLTLNTAIGRAFAYYLSWLILCIGYMMAGWDDQKRALHDRLADTRVIQTR